jgi:hypothetical protein
MKHFLFRGERLGGHVHVHVFAGTELQARNQARPKLGTLTMDPDDWRAFQALVDEGADQRGGAAAASFEGRSL